MTMKYTSQNKRTKNHEWTYNTHVLISVTVDHGETKIDSLCNKFDILSSLKHLGIGKRKERGRNLY